MAENGNALSHVKPATGSRKLRSSLRHDLGHGNDAGQREGWVIASVYGPQRMATCFHESKSRDNEEHINSQPMLCL